MGQSVIGTARVLGRAAAQRAAERWRKDAIIDRALAFVAGG